MLGYFLDTSYLSYICLSNCLSLKYCDTDINPKLLLKSSVTVMILAIIGNEQIIIFIACVQKGISDSVPVSIETSSDTTCKHSVLASLVRLQY